MNLIPATNSPHATLTLIRNPDTTLDTVAETLNVTPHYAAGVMDAVTGVGEFNDLLDYCEPSEWVKAEYRDGFAAGLFMVEEEANAECWAEQAVVQAMLANVEPLAVCCDDCPF